ASRISRISGGSRLGRFGWMLRWFSLLAAATLLIMAMLGAGSYLQAKLVTSPVHAMKGLAASMSSQFFADMLAMEVHAMKTNDSAYTLSLRSMTHFLFRFFMNINPLDPKTLLASEVPGMWNEQQVLLRGNSGTAPTDYPPSSKAHTPADPEQPSGEQPPEPSDVLNLEELLASVDRAALQEVVDNSKLPDKTPVPVQPPSKPPVAAAGSNKVFIY